MAQLRGFVSATSERPVSVTDKKTGEVREWKNRSFNVEGVWLQLRGDKSVLPDKGRQVTVSFHTESTSKEEKGKKKYFNNHICDGYQYVA